ncbi:hypothetical protein KIN20_003680 [Parelaphostrongylus tenuis]|uniref:Uncharacterized protein n=1 Tax=Parelaphostrongylus tenuis TaxID=148309 RepID=A0AAD5QIS3_PARTN|nr:hypothetical protein KIN20_003680 [Parelaphostrongylus tenuis]
MTKCSTDHSMMSLLAAISIALGCGVMPAGQSSTRTFIVTGFSLPVAMVYTGNTGESARAPGIAKDKGGAQIFVQRLVMQTVFDVLERQARSAFLSDAVTSAILDQLTVNVTYEPMECQGVALSPTEMVNGNQGYALTALYHRRQYGDGICTAKMNMEGMCMPAVREVT